MFISSYIIPIKDFQRKLMDNFIHGSKQSLHIFTTIKIPLLIISTLFNSIINSNILFSSIKLKEGKTSFLSNVVLIPISEEIMFRGFIQNGLKKMIALIALKICVNSSSKKTIKRIEYIAYQSSRIATSILFGLLHYPGGGNIQVLSTSLGAFYGESELIEKRNLTSAIACHMTNNLISQLLKNITNY